jgi:hypothetical protein
MTTMISKELELEHDRLHRRLTALQTLMTQLLAWKALPNSPLGWTDVDYRELQALAAMVGESANEVSYSCQRVRQSR